MERYVTLMGTINRGNYQLALLNNVSEKLHILSDKAKDGFDRVSGNTLPVARPSRRKLQFSYKPLVSDPRRRIADMVNCILSRTKGSRRRPKPSGDPRDTIGGPSRSHQQSLIPK